MSAQKIPPNDEQFQHWTPAQFQAYTAQAHAAEMVSSPSGKPSKYRNKRVTADGYTFDSQAEYAYYCALQLRLQAGDIRQLQVHPTYPLIVQNVKIGVYEGDFAYEERGPEQGQWIFRLDDVKGMVTPVYSLKRKLMKALYHIVIQEIAVRRHRPTRTAQRRKKRT